jgi:hypothetical protein
MLKRDRSRKELAVIHHRLSKELFEYFTILLVGCLRMEGLKEDHVDIIAQRLENSRLIIEYK